MFNPCFNPYQYIVTIIIESIAGKLARRLYDVTAPAVPRLRVYKAEISRHACPFPKGKYVHITHCIHPNSYRIHNSYLSMLLTAKTLSFTSKHQRQLDTMLRANAI